MSMPQIPEEKHRPCLKETVIDLLESIALEEIALSHLVNAEAEKIQTFLHVIKDSHSCCKGEELIKFNASIGKIIDTVIMKEWILLKKLESVMQIDYKDHHKKDDCHHKKHHHWEKDCQCDECNSHIKIRVKCACHEGEDCDDYENFDIDSCCDEEDDD